MDKLNKQELRRLAEEAISGDWFDGGDLRYSDDKTGEVHGLNVEDERFIVAANPAAVLSLLDELEQYRKDALRYQWLCDQPGFQLWLDGVLRDEEINSTGLDVDIDIDALMAKEGGANG